MIIQADAGDFPRYWDRVLFIAGLAIYTAGQVLINLGQPFVEAQRPVDFAHWGLLVGVVLLLPFAGRLPRRNIHLVTLPLLLAGVAFTIGMCVLDFVFWALPNGEMESEVARRLIDTPSIWGPFITFGPNYILMPALSYWKVSRLGPALVVLGVVVMFFGTHWFNVGGWALILAGYLFCFNGLRPSRLLD